jgi:hypothetical protein
MAIPIENVDEFARIFGERISRVPFLRCLKRMVISDWFANDPA